MQDIMMIVLVVIIVLAVVIYSGARFIVFLVKGRKGIQSTDTASALRLALSSEDALSQVMIVLGLAFAMLALFGLNRQIGYVVSWQTLLLFISLVALFLGFRLKLLYPAVAGSVCVMVWYGAQGAEWASTAGAQAVTVLVGLGLIGLGYYLVGLFLDTLPKFARYATSFYLLGLMVVCGLFFFLSTNVGLSQVQDWASGALWVKSFALSVLLTVTILAMLGVMVFNTSKHVGQKWETLVVVLSSLVLLALLALPSGALLFESYTDMYNYEKVLRGFGVFYAAVFNIATFGLMVCVILSGYSRRESWRINLGAGLLFILIFIKYFDWFFTFLDKSVFFLGAGLLLFFVGYFMERARKTMLARMQKIETE